MDNLGLLRIAGEGWQELKVRAGGGEGPTRPRYWNLRDSKSDSVWPSYSNGSPRFRTAMELQSGKASVRVILHIYYLLSTIKAVINSSVREGFNKLSTVNHTWKCAYYLSIHSICYLSIDSICYLSIDSICYLSIGSICYLSSGSICYLSIDSICYLSSGSMSSESMTQFMVMMVVAYAI